MRRRERFLSSSYRYSCTYTAQVNPYIAFLGKISLHKNIDLCFTTEIDPREKESYLEFLSLICLGDGPANPPLYM